MTPLHEHLDYTSHHQKLSSLFFLSLDTPGQRNATKAKRATCSHHHALISVCLLSPFMPFLFLWGCGREAIFTAASLSSSPNVRYLRRRFHGVCMLVRYYFRMFFYLYLLAVVPMNKYRNVLLRSPVMSDSECHLRCILASNPMYKLVFRHSECRMYMSNMICWVSWVM